MSEKEFDILEEPSITSGDPNERKLARRLRIQRRFDALKKQDGPEDEEIIETTQTEKQIEASAELLEKLMSEGDEIISNVRVANDAREDYRRNDDVAIRKKLMQMLEEEAEDSLQKYKIISEKWATLLASKDPLDIHAGIQSQNAKCLIVLGQKDASIAELKQELRNSDEKFTLDQKKQSEDINLLTERIDAQISTITKAYRRELLLIDDVLKNERNALFENVAKRWDNLYQQRKDEEMNGVERRKEIMRDYQIEMKRALTDHQEEYRAQKIELETECQNLQQEVERMKAICMMNAEKLDYSYAVLKRREDENTIVKNQQKRRLNKLQNVINDLRKSYGQLEESTRLEIQKLTEQVIKANKNMSELEAKSNHFMMTNEKQYLDIWEMNTRNANELVEKIMTADRIIHEQTLGLDWEAPEQPLLKKEDLPSYQKAMTELQQKKQNREANLKIFETHKISETFEDMNLERRLLNHILKLISDHSGFLIEDKLRQLLTPHSLEDNVIIRLDTVFQALSIKSEEQIDLLLNFFLPYSYCVTCKTEEEDGSIFTPVGKIESSCEEPAARIICSSASRRPEDSCDHEYDITMTLREISEIGRYDEETGSSGENSTRSYDNISSGIPRIIDSRITSAPGRSSEDFSSLAHRAVTCKKGHLLEIEAENVTRALKEFVDKYRDAEAAKIDEINDVLTKNCGTLSRCLTNEDVTNFWQRYRDVFSSKKEKLWDGLMIGLHKYYGILKDRHRLNNETDYLRRQNEELRRLLETYMIKPETILDPLEPRTSVTTIGNGKKINT